MTTAIYVRISQDDEHEGKGVARQEQDCRALVERLGWSDQPVIIYSENDTSATRGRRPEYERLMSAARDGEITRIVVWDADRLTRTPREAEDLIDLVEQHGVRIANVTGDEDLSTSDGRMMFRIKIVVARREIEQTRKRVQRMNDQRAAEGLPTARPGYGYYRVDGRDVMVDAEAQVIRETARRVLQGDTLRAVAADLNARRVPSPGGAPWQGITLRQMIRRPSLAGLRTHRGKVVGRFNPDLHPAILDEDTHARLEALLTDPTRRTGTGGRMPVHLLSGLAVCGRCGGKMKRLPGWTPKPGQASKPVKPAYACSACHKVRRLQEPVDDYVTAVVLRRLLRPDAVELFSRGDAGAVKDARDAIAAIDARLATAADQFADGDLTGEQLRRITARLRADRTVRERVLAKAMPTNVPPDLAGPHAKAVWERLSIDAKRAVIDTLADVVIQPQGIGRSFDPALVEVNWK